MPFLTRTFTPFEVLNEEGLSIIEENADTILQEVGLEFRGDADALAPVPRSRRRRPGRAGPLPARHVPARSSRRRAPRAVHPGRPQPARNVAIGGPYTVLAPNYGTPFVRDLDNGRRYGTIEDFRNFVKLAY